MYTPSFDLQDIADNLLALLKEGEISEDDFQSIVGNPSELFKFFRVFAFKSEKVVERIFGAGFSPEIERKIVFGMSEELAEFLYNCAEGAIKKAERECPGGSEKSLEDLAVANMGSIVYPDRGLMGEAKAAR